jgi:DNA topoisomerase I
MDTATILEETKLTYITDSIPGITRQKDREKFIYLNPQGEVITDEKTLQRIQKLVLPPAWENVWISPKPTAYLQATGLDAKKRKQYRYHDQYLQLTQNYKFDKLIDFVKLLPQIRQQVSIDLQKTGISYEKVVATTIWLLENTLIRIGNDSYAKQNKSYGLTTIRNDHVNIQGSTIKFSFKGKSGVYHNVTTTNRRVASVLKKCQELPEQELLEYIDETGKRHDITSDDINQYLKTVTGENITAKDFRTWGGTTTAAELFTAIGPKTTQKDIKKTTTQVVKEVAQHLRNKPSTSKKYYIHPSIIQAYSSGYTLENLSTHPQYKCCELSNGLQPHEIEVANMLQTFHTNN